MKALIGETVVAEAPIESIIGLEGNAYFPPDAVTPGVLRDSHTPYTCPWKGVAQYHDIVVGETVVTDAAWSYPNITQFAAERVGHDFSRYIAFDPGQVRLEN
jgi:uncharacterized protein (DUF427 family)